MRTQALLAVRWSIPFWLFAVAGLPLVLHANVHRHFFFALFYAFVLLPGVFLATIILGGLKDPPWLVGFPLICLGQYLGVYALVRFGTWLRARLDAKHERQRERTPSTAVMAREKPAP